jgi:hypothetical protein
VKEKTVRRGFVGNLIRGLFGKNKVEKLSKIQHVKPVATAGRVLMSKRTHKTRGRFGASGTKLSRKLSKTQKAYAGRKIRQFNNQGLSKGMREIRIKNDLYLQICLYGKAI